MASYLRSWVIDKSDKRYESYREMINNLVKSDHSNYKEIDVEELPNELKYHQYYVADPYNTSYSTLIQFLADMTYDPIVLSVIINTKDDMSLKLEEADKCIKYVIKQLLDIEVSYNRMVKYDGYYQFLPHDKERRRIYADYETVGKISDTCKLNDESNHLFTSSNSYINYLLETDQLVNISNDRSGREDVNYLSLQLINHSPYDDHNVVLKAYGGSEHVDLLLWEEIASMWGFIVEDNVSIDRLIVKAQDGFPWNLNDFFESAKRNIRLGKLIAVKITGDWQLKTLTHKPLIMYAAHRAYLDYGYPFISSVRVNDDMSISAEFSTYNEYKKYVKCFREYLDRSSNWSIIPCDNFVDAVIKRYEINDYNHNQSLILFDKDSVYLVSDVSLDNYTFVGRRNEFEAALRSFFNTCEQLYTTDGVDLDQMALEDMINIVYTNGRNILCFEKPLLDNIAYRDIPLEPILMSDTNIARYENLVYGLSGYFDFGPLKGINVKPPVRKIKVPDGAIEVDFLRGYEEATIPVLEVKVITRQGPYDLFKIATNEIVMVREMVSILWSMGWFLTDWGISYYEHTDDLSFSLIRKIPFLTIASDSYERGYIALSMLQSIVSRLEC